jgi:uncharacterized membrane protein YkoI
VVNVCWPSVRKLTAAELCHSLNVQSLPSIWSLMKRTIALLAALGLMLAPAAFADGKGKDRDRGEASEWTYGQLTQGQDQGWGNQFSPGQAREAVKEGRTVPLSKIFQTLKREYGGYQLGADLYSQESGGAVYEIDWLTDDGRKVHVTVDAQTGAIINRRGS